MYIHTSITSIAIIFVYTTPCPLHLATTNLLSASMRFFPFLKKISYVSGIIQNLAFSV